MMKYFFVLLTANCLLMTCALCASGLAQPDALPDSAIAEMRSYLASKGYDRSAFPRSEFDPRHRDPLIDFLAWDAVRPGLEAELKQRLGLSTMPDLDLHLASDRGIAYRFQFKPQLKRVSSSLNKVLDIDDRAYARDKFFANAKPLLLMREDFKTDFVGDAGRIKLEVVRDTLTNLQHQEGPLKRLGRSVAPFLKADQYAYIETAWVITELAAGTSGRYCWRLRLGLERLDQSWNLFCCFQVGTLSNSEPDSRKTRLVGDSDNTSVHWPKLLTINATGIGNQNKEPMAADLSDLLRMSSDIQRQGYESLTGKAIR